jgi:hypothetical protein
MGEPKGIKVLGTGVGYFEGKKFMGLLAQYKSGGCVDVSLRDQIMELVLPIINGVLVNKWSTTHNDDHDHFVNVAWVAVESALYKIDSNRPPSTAFNFITRIIYTSLCNYFKGQWKDHNESYKDKYTYAKQHFSQKTPFHDTIDNYKEKWRHCPTMLDILDAIEKLNETDDDASFMLTTKLAKMSGLNRNLVKWFLRLLREGDRYAA